VASIESQLMILSMVNVLIGIFVFPNRVGAKEKSIWKRTFSPAMLLPNGLALSVTWLSATLRH
jgi:hypothetical protein